MAEGQRFLPERLELDLADERLTPQMARFIKNLVFSTNDSSQSTNNQSSANGKYRPLESTQVFDSQFQLPSGYNHFLGAFSSKEENCLIFHYYNDEGNHGVYFIDGNEEAVQTVYLKECLNYQLSPEHFIHEGGAWLEVFNYTDPNTGLPRKRSYYWFTDGYNDLRFICIEDSIATNGFDSNLFPYFVNPHPECFLINAGVSRPKGCIKLTDVPNDNSALQNNLKFNTWQFMVRFIDVYGRPSEWGDISDIYIPGTNDCIGSSEFLSRCIDLTFDAGNSFVNIIEIAYRNCNDLQWYRDNSLFLYKGSNFGDWWMRDRNDGINYNPETNEITYRFCKDKECDPIPQEETNRNENPLPRVTQSVAKIGKFIGVSNNKHHFFPFEDSVMDKVSITVTPPTPSDSPIRNIEIFVPIYNPFVQTYQPVYKDDDGIWVWGGRRSFSNSYTGNVGTDYKQFFGDEDRRGFIGYLAATGTPPQATISELYYVNELTNEFVKVEDFNIVHQPAQEVGPILDDYRRRWYQKFTFNSVAPAKYIFRIASSYASLTESFENTSTYVGGQFPWINKQTNFDTKISPTPELIVDVCEGDYSSLNDSKVLVIYDLTSAEVGTNTHPASGYIYEKKEDDIYTIPIELLRVQKTFIPIFTEVRSEYTDHNGFYFVGTKSADYDIDFFGFYKCNFLKLLELEVGSQDRLYEQNKAISENEDFFDYAEVACNRTLITASVTECRTGIPVPGVGVVLSRGQVGITGADGKVVLIAHDLGEPAQPRIDELYYIPTICAFSGCDSICVDTYQVVVNKCVSCADRNIVATPSQVLFYTKRGLLSGGNYGVAIWGEDWMGRQGFAQTRDNLYFTTPTLIQTNTFSPSVVTLTIDPAATFPLWVDEIKIGITKELSMSGIYITWIVDRVEFIDNSGNENNINPTQIKIYYASLSEYNKQNNFNTTTDWQFIIPDQTGSQVNFTSDFAEFYINGDGQFFPTLVRALVKYDQDGQYFLIDYDSALKNLKQYAQIRLGRPSQCTTKDVFYQICGTIKVINGKAQTNTLVLNAFDTYYKYRQIPIPIGTEENPENVVRTFGFPFEHHSPSDFWGDHCINIGKENVRNPYEAEVIIENQIMISGALSVNGQLNFLNYFEEALSINFNSWNFGGIVSIIPFVAGIRAVCQYNCFTVGFNDNTLRISESGQVIVPSAESRFGNPEVKIGNSYGCQFWDKNTIRSKDGRIQFIDSLEGVLIQDDYSQSYIMSRRDDASQIVGGINSWLLPKIKYIQEWNKNNDNKKYLTGTINPAANQYLLTDFTIRSNNYINSERNIEIEKHETVAFEYNTKLFRCFLEYTAQGYGYIEGQAKSNQLFSFTNNINTHYSSSPSKTYGTIYGSTVNRIIRAVVVIDGFQKKKFNNITIHGKHLYFSDYNRTDSNQESRILIAQWKKGDFYFSSAILCNLNTPTDPNYPYRPVNNIMDGDKMYGSIFDVRLVGNPVDDNIYTELLGISVEVSAEGKIISG